MSRIAYFKRKFIDDDDEAPFSFRTYCQTVSIDLTFAHNVVSYDLVGQTCYLHTVETVLNSSGYGQA